MGSMNGCTHFQCAGCSDIKLIKDMNVSKIAYNIYDHDTQNKFYYRPYYVMLCNDCFKDTEKKDKEKDNARDSNSKKKRSS